MKMQARFPIEGDPGAGPWLLVVVFLVTVESESPEFELVSIGHGIKALSPHRNLRLLQPAAPVAWHGMACCAVAALVRV